jgi:hypothetical protein
MRNRMLPAGLLVLLMAGCSSSAAGTPAAMSTPRPSTAIAAPSVAAPTAKAAPLEVAVQWDGSKCTYLGPTVILDGTLTRFTFTATGTVPLELVIVGVEPGTTWEQIQADAKTGLRSDEPPAYVILTGLANIPANSSALFTISTKAGVGETPVGGWFVGCGTAPKPEGTDVMYPAVLLQVAGG